MFKKLANKVSKIFSQKTPSNDTLSGEKLESQQKKRFAEFKQVSQVPEEQRPQWLNEVTPISQYILSEVASKSVGWVDRVSDGKNLRISAKGVSTLSPEKAENPLKNYRFIKDLRGVDGGSFGKVGLYRKLDSNGSDKLDKEGKSKQYAIKTGRFKDPDTYGGNVTELRSLIAALGNESVVKLKKTRG